MALQPFTDLGFQMFERYFPVKVRKQFGKKTNILIAVYFTYRIGTAIKTVPGIYCPVIYKIFMCVEQGIILQSGI